MLGNLLGNVAERKYLCSVAAVVPIARNGKEHPLSKVRALTLPNAFVGLKFLFEAASCLGQGLKDVRATLNPMNPVFRKRVDLPNSAKNERGTTTRRSCNQEFRKASCPITLRWVQEMLLAWVFVVSH